MFQRQQVEQSKGSGETGGGSGTAGGGGSALSIRKVAAGRPVSLQDQRGAEGP